MAKSLVEVVCIAPVNPMWSSVGDIAPYLQSGISAHGGFFPHIAFGMKPSEVVTASTPSVAAVRSYMGAVRRELGDTENIAVHAELGRRSLREFWGLSQARHMWPESACCVVLHDPPHLPEFPRAAPPQSLGGPLGRIVRNLSQHLSQHGRRKVTENVVSGVRAFLCLTKGGAELTAERFPWMREQVGVLPPWIVGAIPEELEPNQREITEKLQVAVLVSEETAQGVGRVLDALAITNSQLSLSGRVGVKVRGVLQGTADQKALEKRLRERVKKLNIDWLVDVRLGLMAPNVLENFLREADIAIVSSNDGAGFRTCSPYMRFQGWAVAVLMADSGFAREVVADGEDGVIYDGSQPSALARKLLELLTEPEKRVAMARNLRQKAKSERSPVAVAGMLHQLYREIFEARSEDRPVAMPRALRGPLAEFEVAAPGAESI